jgi:tetratricopeptide (TPR) repeat protein
VSKASQLRQKAQEYLKKGKVSDAVEAYKKLLQVESRNPNLYNELGDIYLRAEDRMQAVMSFDKAVEHYEMVALYNNAVAVCKKILRVVPNRLESIYKLGELKAKQKYVGEASRMFIQYLDLATSADTDSSSDNLLPKVEAILELVPEDDELHARVAEAMTHLGLKIVAAEVFARLIGRSASSGDSEKTDHYRGRLDLLREALTADEQARIEEILAGSLDLEDEGDDGEPDLTVEEIDTEAAAEAVGSDPEETEVVEEAEAGEQAAEEKRAQEPAVVEEPPAAMEEAPVEEIDESPETGAEPEAECVIPADDTEESVGEYEIPVEPDLEAALDAASSAVSAGEEAVSSPAKDEAAVEPAIAEQSLETGPDVAGKPAGVQAEEGEAGVTEVEDELSDILEAEDAANEATAVDTDQLVEEITSDVEENDFKSHYDLGMAYIEMALFNEAIRELQISARSEQLQLRSLEMIGHCFLQLDNPRLAVKQLNRGLEIAATTGGDNLGIHYNLGLAYEALDEPDKAREHFEEVYIVDVTFRDISEKMKKYSAVS